VVEPDPLETSQQQQGVKPAVEEKEDQEKGLPSGWEGQRRVWPGRPVTPGNEPALSASDAAEARDRPITTNNNFLDATADSEIVFGGNEDSEEPSLLLHSPNPRPPQDPEETESAELGDLVLHGDSAPTKRKKEDKGDHDVESSSELFGMDFSTEREHTVESQKPSEEKDAKSQSLVLKDTNPGPPPRTASLLADESGSEAQADASASESLLVLGEPSDPGPRGSSVFPWEKQQEESDNPLEALDPHYEFKDLDLVLRSASTDNLALRFASTDNLANPGGRARGITGQSSISMSEAPPLFTPSGPTSPLKAAMNGKHADDSFAARRGSESADESKPPKVETLRSNPVTPNPEDSYPAHSGGLFRANSQASENPLDPLFKPLSAPSDDDNPLSPTAPDATLGLSRFDSVEVPESSGGDSLPRAGTESGRAAALRALRGVPPPRPRRDQDTFTTPPDSARDQDRPRRVGTDI